MRPGASRRAAASPPPAPDRSPASHMAAEPTGSGARRSVDDGPDPVGDGVGVAGAVDDAPSPASRPGPGRRRAPRRGTRRPRAPAGRRAGPPGRGHRRRRRRARRRGRARGRRSPRRSTARERRRRRARAPTPWYDERRRHVAVAHDPRAARERGADDLGDVLGPVGGHQQRLGRAGRSARRRRARSAPERAPERRAAGLERLDHVDARDRAAAATSRGTCVLFPHAVAALEHDEPAASLAGLRVRRLGSVGPALAAGRSPRGRRSRVRRPVPVLDRERPHRAQLVAGVQARDDR